MTRSGRPGLDSPSRSRGGSLLGSISISGRCRPCSGRRFTTATSPSARGSCRSPAGRCRCSTKGVIPEHRAVRGRRRGLRRLAHGRARGRRPSRARVPAGGALERPRAASSPGQAQYTLLTNEQGGIVDDLIVYELDPQRFLLIVNACEPRARLRLAARARGAGSGGARRLRRLRAARGAGAARARAARPACRAGLHVRRRRDRRRRVHGQPHRLHRRGGRRAARRHRRGRRAVGSRAGARRPSRAGSARATRCGSRSATRCTGTTSRPTPTRSRPGSAGSARSTRSSPAPTSCGGSRRTVPSGSSSAFVMEEAGYPAAGDADRRGRRGHLRLALADAGARDRPGLRPGRELAQPGTELTIDVRGRPGARVW